MNGPATSGSVLHDLAQRWPLSDLAEKFSASLGRSDLTYLDPSQPATQSVKSTEGTPSRPLLLPGLCPAH